MPVCTIRSVTEDAARWCATRSTSAAVDAPVLDPHTGK